MPSVSVSNLDLFRSWREDEDMELETLIRRLRGEEPPTEAMKAGTALHKALETADFSEAPSLSIDGYYFAFTCDGEIALPPIREMSVQKMYGQLEVRGRVDGLIGKTVLDYKTTGQFDPDRFFEGYQWRYYLDMLQCDRFMWKVFVLREGDTPLEFDVTQMHELIQYRYPGMTQDCERLAADYSEFLFWLEKQGISVARVSAAKA